MAEAQVETAATEAGAAAPEAPVAVEIDPAADAEARSLYEAGVLAFSDGRFEDALNRWSQAYDLTARPALLFNLGTAEDRLSHGAEALARYESYLEAVPTASNANYVRRRIAVLRDSLGTAAEATTSAESAGTADPAPTVPVAHHTPLDRNTSASEGPSLLGPMVVLGIGGAIAVGGLITAIVADGTYGELQQSCPDGVCPSDVAGDIDSLGTLTLTTDILLGVGVATLIGGGVWLTLNLIGADESERAVENLSVGVGPGQIRLRGAF